MAIPKSLLILLSALAAITAATPISVAEQVLGVPLLITYQGELKSAKTGEPVPDVAYDMIFRVYNSVSGGDWLWEGNYTEANGNPVVVKKGTFSVLLGSGKGNELPASVFWGSGRWLEVKVGAEILEPRQTVSSVPYAFRSLKANLAVFLPIPFYDSGWIRTVYDPEVGQTAVIVLDHNLHWNPEQLVVDITILDDEPNPPYVWGPRGLRQAKSDDAWWDNLTDETLTVYVPTWYDCDKIRVRIWAHSQ